MSNFDLSITHETDSVEDDATLVVFVTGSLNVVNYAVNDVAKQLTDAGDAQFSVRLAPADGGKSLVSVTGDGDTVVTLLKSKVTKARKAERDAATPAE